PCRAAKHARRSEGLDWNLGQLINDWLKRRWRNWLAFGSSSLHPGGFGSENFRQSLFRTFAESGAVGKIRNVRNVAAVFFAVENVDVIVFHSSPPRDRLYRSTRASNRLASLLALHRRCTIRMGVIDYANGQGPFG